MLSWTDNAYASAPRGFELSVYSASYDLDQNLCGPTGASREPRWRQKFLWRPDSTAYRAASGTA